jgi:hypothetical protein
MRQWAKLHTKILTEPKVLRLTDQQFRCFINLIALAGYIDDAGRLGTAEDIAMHLRLSEAKTGARLDELEAVGIALSLNSVWFLKNWDEYNGRPPSDDKAAVRERVTRHRENKVKRPISNDEVTPLHSQRNDPRIEKNRIDSSGADAPPPPPDPVKDLAAVFEQASGIKLPQPTTEKAQRQVGALWWHPLKEMIRIANGQAPDILRRAIGQMRKDHLTVANPNSVSKVFASLYGEKATAGQYPESRTPAL